MFIRKMLRVISLLLDGLAYFAQINIYELFINIAEAGIFPQKTIQMFATRMYAFIGLVMVFKVSISLVTYIMNPDNFNKADVGAPALLKGIIIALVGIVIVPYAFELAYYVQSIVIEKNVIGSMILGITEEEGKKAFDPATGGEIMADAIITAFVRPNVEIEGIDDTCADDPGNCSPFAEFFDDAEKQKIKTIYDETISPYIDPDLLLDSDIINTTTSQSGKEEFVYEYKPFISTACVLFCAYILLVFCIDVAIRSVKLSFLQIIAPIPLIMRVDPKKGKETLNKWIKECISTYLDLFGRLVTIYFAIFLISSLSSVYRIGGGKFVGRTGKFVQVFIMIGILQFAKDLPKLLGDMLGIKLGGGTLSLTKKLASTPLIGGAMVAGAGYGARAVSELGKAGVASVGSLIGKTNAWKGFTSENGLGGKISNKMNAAGNKLSEWGNKANKFTGGHLGNVTSSLGMIGAGTAGAIGNALGMQDRALDRLEMEQSSIMRRNQFRNEQNHRYQGLADSIKKMQDRAWDKISDGTAKKMKDANGNEIDLSQDYRNLHAALEVAKRSGTAEEIAIAQGNFDNFKKQAIEKYITYGRSADPALDKAFDGYVQQCQLVGGELGTVSEDGGVIDEQLGKIKGEITANDNAMIPDKNRLHNIENEKKQVQESIKASKTFMPGPGAGKK